MKADFARLDELIKNSDPKIYIYVSDKQEILCNILYKKFASEEECRKYYSKLKELIILILLSIIVIAVIIAVLLIISSLNSYSDQYSSYEIYDLVILILGGR